jgi:hypothetical protein
MAFSSEVDTGSREENASNKRAERAARRRPDFRQENPNKAIAGFASSMHR